MIRAVLFDMDGTLVDSEGQTDAAIAVVMARHGVAGASLPPNETRGRTWTDVVRALAARYPTPKTLERELVDEWARHIDAVTAIPGAADAVRAAAAVTGNVAVVSSSPRPLVERVLANLGVRDAVRVVVGAEDVAHPKPAPDCFLAAARALDVAPAACLVIEDARAGLTAAKAAGMQTRVVLHACAEPELCRALADDAFVDYAALPPTYWRDLAGRA